MDVIITPSLRYLITDYISIDGVLLNGNKKKQQKKMITIASDKNYFSTHKKY